MEKKTMKCPNCSKRVFDVLNLPKEQVKIELKCAHCGRVVSIRCVDSHSANATKKTE